MASTGQACPVGPTASFDPPGLQVLGIVAGVLLQDHESRGVEFQQLPYHRIFMMLFLELSAPEPVLEAIGFHVLMAFCNTLHVLQPCKAPAFAYSWLELISHRVFLGRVLALTPQQKAWGMFAQLLNDLFKFLAPFLRNVDLEKPIQLLYKVDPRVFSALLACLTATSSRRARCGCCWCCCTIFRSSCATTTMVSAT